ncbi:MAG TPA: transketolase C-terminal domain-containing protein [bacterium]|nr:transketolase C-terminal domain-containing protein [bacterium]HPQ66576.1 transketolase C-terminal domain-containing protein [bacterium]
MRNAYLQALTRLAAENDRILALVADNGAIVYDEFRRLYPNRFINFGISEANMVGAAAGLASCGWVPYVYTISGFITMRAFEQVRNDLCYQEMNVKLVGIGAGFVYSDLGPTHHATEDLALMRALPGMTVLSPADGLEARKATRAAAEIHGPVYLRLSRGNSPAIYAGEYDFQVGRGVVLREGTDVALLGTGEIVRDVLTAAELLEREGVSARVINIHTLKPLDRELIAAAAATGAVVTVEEHSIIGGLGSAVAEALLEENRGGTAFVRLGLRDRFAEGYGSHAEMKEMNGLDAAAIALAARGLVRRGKYSAP